jgi:DNA-binding transcriptional LysR family regulator
MRVRLSRSPAIRDWNDVQYTLAVAQTGSFYAAAGHLGVHQTTVARRVQRLERELATKLLARHSHGMVLTAAGESLIAKAAAMEDAATIVRSEVAGFDARLNGTIRVAISEGIGRYWLIPALADFQLRYPDIGIELLTEARAVNMLVPHVDISISLTRPKLPRLIGVHVGDAHYNLFASRNYLRQHGYPQSVDELRRHKLLDLHLYRTVSHLAWWNELTREIGNVAFLADSSSVYLAAIQEGLGIGMAPTFCTFMLPDLMLLPIQPSCSVELWLVWHEAAKGNAKIRAFTNFLKARFMRDRARWFC